MFKIIFSIFLLSSLVLSASLAKPTGCDLSQDGDVSLNIAGYGGTQKANYKANKEVGKNFKELFVGSSIRYKDANLSIRGIDSNKRIKNKARTGYIEVTLILKGKKQNIEMSYAYNEGYFQAWGKQKNMKNLSFALEIKALLCYSKGK